MGVSCMRMDADAAILWIYKNRGDINEDWHTWITVPKKN